MAVFEGMLIAKGLKFALVASRFNDFITSRLVDGAIDCLTRHGADRNDIDVYWCPGGFELPQLAGPVAASGRYDAVVCLGAIIQGDTPHFQYIASEAAKGIARIGMESGVPVTFGVITVDTLEQAIERAGTRHGNKGEEAARSAIELANVLKQANLKKT